jgi:hypothetical protein
MKTDKREKVPFCHSKKEDNLSSNRSSFSPSGCFLAKLCKEHHLCPLLFFSFSFWGFQILPSSLFFVSLKFSEYISATKVLNVLNLLIHSHPFQVYFYLLSQVHLHDFTIIIHVLFLSFHFQSKRFLKDSTTLQSNFWIYFTHFLKFFLLFLLFSIF